MPAPPAARGVLARPVSTLPDGALLPVTAAADEVATAEEAVVGGGQVRAQGEVGAASPTRHENVGRRQVAGTRARRHLQATLQRAFRH